MATGAPTVEPPETYGYPLQTWESAVFLAVDCVIALGIIIGNTLVILSVALERRLRTPTNAFIVSLAVGDLAVGLIVIPIDVVFVALGHATELTPIACLACSNIMTTMIIVSILHLGVIAYDRYLAITNPLCYVMKMSRLRVGVLIAVAWGLALVLSSLPLLGWNNLHWSTSHRYCDLLFIHSASYRLFSVTFSVGVPLNCMLFFYFKMFRVAREHMNRIAAQEATAHRKQTLRRDVKAAKTVAIILGCFLALWTPATLVSVMDSFVHMDDKLQEQVLIYELIVYHIAFSNSMVNPMIYAYRNREFRYSFMKLIGTVFRCQCWTRRVQAAAGLSDAAVSPDQQSTSQS